MMMCWLPAHAEVTCRAKDDPTTAVPATTPTANFTIHDNGTVTDTTAGLMWMRCSLGETWGGSTCTGTASTWTWEQALQVAQDINSGSSNADNDSAVGFAGHTDWRLPNKNELASIVEDRCHSPSLNELLFPTSGSENSWSSSPSASPSDNALGVEFFTGVVGAASKDAAFGVRLVRAGQ
jgi:hypothetical protein